MADPIDQTSSNPQSLVDAALGTTPVATPLAPLVPLTQAEPLVEPPASVPMGDDTPLAFAMSTPTPISAEPVNMTAIPDPGATQTSSYLPPVPPAPTMAPEMPKKKSKTGLIIGGVVALLLFVFGGIAGYQYLTTGEVPMIAKIINEEGTDAQNSSGVSDTSGTEKQAKKTGDNTAAKQAAALQAAKDKAAAEVADAIAQKADDTQAAADLLAKQRADADVAAAAAGVNNDSGVLASYKYVLSQTAAHGLETGTFTEAETANLKKYYTSIGADTNEKIKSIAKENLLIMDSPSRDVPIGGSCVVSATNLSSSCASGGGVCTNGKCMLISNCLPGDDCPIACSTTQIADTSNWTKTQEPGGGSFCSPNGSNCNRYRVELKNGNTHCFLYYGQNCGEPESCGPGGDNTKTTTPTMSCTGLNYTPTTVPVIGSVLTFTCTGAVVPSTAGTLSYKYRYNINSGAYTAMTANTLTIAACGTYSVECQACATLGGVLKCDPIWTGATTP